MAEEDRDAVNEAAEYLSDLLRGGPKLTNEILSEMSENLGFRMRRSGERRRGSGSDRARGRDKEESSNGFWMATKKERSLSADRHNVPRDFGHAC